MMLLWRASSGTRRSRISTPTGEPNTGHPGQAVDALLVYMQACTAKVASKLGSYSMRAGIAYNAMRLHSAMPGMVQGNPEACVHPPSAIAQVPCKRSMRSCLLECILLRS